MFGWFKKDSDSLYTPKQRNIYGYFDGQKKVKADPIVLWKRLMAVGAELSVDISVGSSTLIKGEDAAKAQENAIRKIRDIFQIKSLEEGGLTETETCDLLDHFLLYCEKLKKNSKMPVTCATVPLQNCEPFLGDGHTTVNGPGFNSTPNANNTGEPEPSRMVSPSVLEIASQD